MRIKSLKVKDFYILKDFEIKFNNNLSVLIGENGSGKSTILELIADIFGHLHKFFILNDRDAAYVEGYQIVYDYPLYGINHTIEIHSKTKNGKYVPQIWIDKKDVSIAHIEKEYGGMSNLLPAKIILSYAGVSDHLRSLSEHFEEKYKKEIIKVNNQYTLSPLNLPKERPFIYIKPEHLSMLVLSILMSDENGDEQFINDFLSIDRYNCEINFIFKRPSWAKNNDEQWWGIKGNVATKFFEKIDEYADNCIKEKNTLTYRFKGTFNLKFAFDELITSQKDIAFTILDTLLYDDLLSEINISWKLENGDEMDLNRLSEGQKQVVLTQGVTLIYGEEEKNLLFLFDEPDVFMHPKWQQKYIENVRNSLDDTSMAIITSHSPNIVSDLKNQNLHLLRNGKVITKNLKYYGKTVDNILGDYFGLDSTRSNEVTTKIEVLWQLIQQGKYDAPSFEEKMKELISIIGADDFEIMAMNRDILRKRHEKAK